MSDDLRAEFASLAASLRAYLEWQKDAGTLGFPRRPPGAAPAVEASDAATATTAPPVATVEPVATQPARTPAAAPGPLADPNPHAYADAPPEAHALLAAKAPLARVLGPTTSMATPAVAAPAPSGPPVDRHVRLPELATEVASCTRCVLSETRTQTVFARGNADAAICFVGEAPGADEDAQGRPFVGRAGQLLDKMIGAMGLSPERDVYVCNIIKCRPPGNRKPEPAEMATCIPYLHEQLALVEPRVIVAMGNTAVAALLDTKLGITKLRGQWKLYRGRTLVMPTYHPSYLLRPSPQQLEAKRQAWQDLQLVMKELGLQPTRES